jgi:hypothetical protein
MAARPLQPTFPFADEVRLLAHAAEPALLLDRSGVILFVNEAWERFARQNGGNELVTSRGLVGSRWFDQIAGEEPRRLHRLLLERAARRLGPGRDGSVVQLNESNSPELARLVATELRPVFGADREVSSLSIIHRVVRERPLADVYPPVVGPPGRWRGDRGIVQCSCCRRVQRPEEPAEWDLSSPLLAVPPGDTCFAYCTLCLALHYPAGAGVELEAEAEAELEAEREARPRPRPSGEAPPLRLDVSAPPGHDTAGPGILPGRP